MTDFGPYLEFVRIQTEMNKLFESLQELREPGEGPERSAGWVPNVDICECGDGLVVEAELPGVDPESLEVKVGSGTLVLAGTKTRPSAGERRRFVTQDRGHGAFRREIPLNAAVNTHKARATLEALMHQPYARVIVLHITIIAGGFVILALGSPVMGLVLLVALKSGVDVKAHLKERRKFASESVSR